MSDIDNNNGIPKVDADGFTIFSDDSSADAPLDSNGVPQGMHTERGLDPGVILDGNPEFDEAIEDSSEPSDLANGFSKPVESSGNDYIVDPEEQQTKESAGPSIFNDPTPVLDVNEVQQKSASAEPDSSIFNAPTPNLDVNEVAKKSEEAAKAPRENYEPVSSFDTDDDKNGGNGSLPTDPAGSTSSFMASMQMLYSSMGSPTKDQTPATPAAPENKTEAAPVQAPAEKAKKEKKHWDYLSKIMNRFDDGKVHTEETEGVKLPEKETPADEHEAAPAAAVNAAAAAPAVSAAHVIPEAQPAAPVTPEQKEPELPYTPAAPRPEASRFDNIGRINNDPFGAAAPVVSSEDLHETKEDQVLSDFGKDASKKPFDEVFRRPDEAAVPAEPLAPALELKPEKPSKEEKKLAREQAKAAKAAAAASAPEKVKPAKAPKAEKKEKPAVDKSELKGIKKFAADTLPVKGDSAKEIIRKIIVIVAAITLIVCAVIGCIDLAKAHNNKKTSEQLQSILASAAKSDSDWSAVKDKYPSVSFPSGMNIKYSQLYAMNQDLVGWIKINGMNIDYPVLQSSDNSYYLKHDFNKQYSNYGSIFMSFENNSKDLDQNTVIFGHSMRRDTQMFTPLHAYKDVSGFKASPVITFSTLYKTYKFKVFAVYITNGSSSGDNGYVFDYTFTNLSTEQNFGEYINEVKQRQLYDTGVDILPTDKIITLSTCTYEFDDARLVVIGRMVRDGESSSVDTSKVKINSNPRYPQAWYDKNNEANPYDGYNKWTAQ